MVNEDLIVEIVRPGTGDPVADGRGRRDRRHLARSRSTPGSASRIGDLTAVLPGPSPCGRTNMRIRGWMGRADQTTKVKGMFVRPEQIAEIGKRHPELGRLRLVVTRDGETDVMTLQGGMRLAERGTSRAKSPRRCARSQSSAATSNWWRQEACRMTARSSRTSVSRSECCSLAVLGRWLPGRHRSTMVPSSRRPFQVTKSCVVSSRVSLFSATAATFAQRIPLTSHSHEPA